MSEASQILEVKFSAGDWSYPIYFSKNSAGYWEPFHAAGYIDPKTSLGDAIERFKSRLRQDWAVRADLEIATTEPRPVSHQIAANNSFKLLDERSNGGFNRPPSV